MRISDWSSDLCSSDLQSGANTLAVAEAAKQVADEIRKDLPPGMTMDVASDESLFIERAIDAVYQTMGEAAILVVVVIFLFMRSEEFSVGYECVCTCISRWSPNT